MIGIDKARVRDAAVTALERELDAMRASAEEARQGATHEEARPENDKDTRAIEASYLARGQAMRVEDTAEAAGRLRFMELRAYDADTPLGASALVEVLVDGAPHLFFVAPVAGGTRVSVDDREVQLITPGSPVGRALMGKLVGDDFELRIAGRMREYEIVDAC